MPAAVYFLGEQSGTPKGQVVLNVLISFFPPLSLSLSCLFSKIFKHMLYHDQEAELYVFLPVATDPPYLLSSLGCIFKIRAPFLTLFS